MALIFYFDWQDGILRLVIQIANISANIVVAIIVANICLCEINYVVHNTTTSELHRKEVIRQKLQSNEYDDAVSDICRTLQQRGADYRSTLGSQDLLDVLDNYNPYDKGLLPNIAECCLNGIWAVRVALHTADC